MKINNEMKFNVVQTLKMHIGHIEMKVIMSRSALR